jgi:hypothetical protein
MVRTRSAAGDAVVIGWAERDTAMVRVAEVSWERATEAVTAVLVGWFRLALNPQGRSGASVTGHCPRSARWAASRAARPASPRAGPRRVPMREGPSPEEP